MNIIILALFLCFVFVNPASIDYRECGLEASPHVLHQSPWLVYLEYHMDGQFVDIRCAGTLVSSRHVLTAAHCVKLPTFDTLKARLGEYNVTTSVDCVDGLCADSHMSVEIEHIKVHSQSRGIENDIAVLTLTTPAPYTDFIRPICLPSKTDLETNKTTLTAAGWGEIQPGIYSEIKKHINLTYRETQVCNNVYKSITIPDSIICAGGQLDLDTCRGDSGGPLVLRRGKAELWGITNAGNPQCGAEGYPGIYTRVGDFIKWMSDYL